MIGIFIEEGCAAPTLDFFVTLATPLTTPLRACVSNFIVQFLFEGLRIVVRLRNIQYPALPVILVILMILHVL